MSDGLYEALELRPRREEATERYLIRPLEQVDMTASGLVMPGEQPQFRGVVEKVSPGGDTELQPGDVVFFQKHAGALMAIGSVERVLFNDPELQARLPAGSFELVVHENGKEHLVGEVCSTCRRVTEGEAKKNIEAMREALVQGAVADATGFSDEPSSRVIIALV
jgi:co-chaperonin GroES (HSP10)